MTKWSSVTPQTDPGNGACTSVRKCLCGLLPPMMWTSLFFNGDKVWVHRCVSNTNILGRPAPLGMLVGSEIALSQHYKLGVYQQLRPWSTTWEHLSTWLIGGKLIRWCRYNSNSDVLVCESRTQGKHCICMGQSVSELIVCVCVCVCPLPSSLSRWVVRCLLNPHKVNHGDVKKSLPQVSLYKSHTTEESLRRRRSGRYNQVLPDNSGEVRKPHQTVCVVGYLLRGINLTEESRGSSFVKVGHLSRCTSSVSALVF